MNFIESGDFHIADFYTVNHDQTNVIDFIPQSKGTIKFLIQ